MAFYLQKNQTHQNNNEIKPDITKTGIKNQDSNPKQVITTFNENLQNFGKIILTKI